jgi:hypothetical protein
MATDFTPEVLHSVYTELKQRKGKLSKTKFCADYLGVGPELLYVNKHRGIGFSDSSISRCCRMLNHDKHTDLSEKLVEYLVTPRDNELEEENNE